MTREEAVWYVNHAFEVTKEELCNSGRFDEAKEFEIAQNMAIEALQDDWIPVSEPPKENGNYIVSLEDAVDTYARFFNGKWFMPLFGSIAREYGEHEITAWMPLPEPYKGGDME